MSTARMSARDALVAVHGARGDGDVVVTTMSPARDWMTLPQHRLDLVLVPSAMGHATSIGLGLALAQPERRVIVCNGDGSMLMNLGSLVTITAARAANLVVLVFDNGVYEVTGAQPIPSPGAVDFVAIARGSGFASVFEYSDIDQWRDDVERVLKASGPTLALLHVEPVLGIPGPRSPGPAPERARRLSDALGR
ncbi:MAG: thiamine pyrophosphate-dependent enzyme [Gemmatimonas sp.]|nr:thiamine pyrophosphate-dependent enzyme [Gemmatimonadaceae bacterium]